MDDDLRQMVTTKQTYEKDYFENPVRGGMRSEEYSFVNCDQNTVYATLHTLPIRPKQGIMPYGPSSYISFTAKNIRFPDFVGDNKYEEHEKYVTECRRRKIIPDSSVILSWRPNREDFTIETKIDGVLRKADDLRISTEDSARSVCGLLKGHKFYNIVYELGDRPIAGDPIVSFQNFRNRLLDVIQEDYDIDYLRLVLSEHDVKGFFPSPKEEYPGQPLPIYKPTEALLSAESGEKSFNLSLSIMPNSKKSKKKVLPLIKWFKRLGGRRSSLKN